MDGNDLAVLFYAGMPSEIKRTDIGLTGLHKFLSPFRRWTRKQIKYFRGRV